MNDDLHKTLEPDPVPDKANGGWKMPEPVFRRSRGRPGKVSRGAAEAVPVGEKTAPESIKGVDAPPAPPPTVEPQPFVSDQYKAEDLNVAEAAGSGSMKSRLLFGLAGIGIIAVVGVVSVFMISAVLLYYFWYR